jgi:hypothetical protein
MEMQLRAFRTSAVGVAEYRTALKAETSSELGAALIARATWIWRRRRPLRRQVSILKNTFLKLSFDITLPRIGISVSKWPPTNNFRKGNVIERK